MENYNPKNTAFPIEEIPGLTLVCYISFNADSSCRKDYMDVFSLGILYLSLTGMIKVVELSQSDLKQV
jgi:hypothetical protein